MKKSLSFIDHMHVIHLTNVIPPLAFARNASSSIVEILQNQGGQQPNLEEDGDGAYILELHMGEMRKQGFAWKPQNHNFPTWAFNKVNNNQLIALDKTNLCDALFTIIK